MTRRLSGEEALQLFVVQLLKLEGAPGILVIRVMNEGKRSLASGSKAKRLGLHPGAPDLIILRPGALAYSLELKRPKRGKQPAGTLSPDQIIFRDHCDAHAMPYGVARTPEEARALLMRWGCLRGRVAASLGRAAA
jgi:hypothetical protein